MYILTDEKGMARGFFCEIIRTLALILWVVHLQNYVLDQNATSPVPSVEARGRPVFCCLGPFAI